MRSYVVHQPVKYNSFKFLLSIITFIFILILYVSEQVYIVSLEKKVSDLRQKNIWLKSTITNLQIKTADLHKGSRIKKIAFKNLGMTMPEGAPARLF